MHNFTTATGEQEHTCEADGIRWTVTVRPLRYGDLSRLVRQAESNGLMLAQLAAPQYVSAIRSAKWGDEDVALNGTAVTDPSIRALVLESFPGLATSAMTEAKRIGMAVEEQRGNSDGAPSC